MFVVACCCGVVVCSVMIVVCSCLLLCGVCRLLFVVCCLIVVRRLPLVVDCFLSLVVAVPLLLFVFFYP